MTQAITHNHASLLEFGMKDATRLKMVNGSVGNFIVIVQDFVKYVKVV